jgi:DNA-binding NarL/FixJ family response regulator
VPELRGLNSVEREVADLIAGGWSDDVIGARLSFVEATVVKVVGRVFEKLGLEPVADPARRAYAMLSLAADRPRSPS